MTNEIGYDRDRFVQVDDQFECLICSTIVRDPKECNGCGHLYCKRCIEDWQQKSKDCPNRCSMAQHTITPISRALQRMYNNLEIRCKNQKCNKVVKLCDLEKHEQECCTPNCINFDNCEKKVNSSFSPKQICSLECELHQEIIKSSNQADVLKLIQEYTKKISSQPGVVAIPSIMTQAYQSNPSVQNAIMWRWDPQCAGTGIRITNNGTNCFLTESAYMFRTVLSDTPMTGGTYYWEIHADDKTENELKIGVSSKKDFNYNSAFCDFDYGWAYYGLGQLRHGSNASGPQYGKRFKKEGVLGIYLNMNKGTLSFALNGEFFGVAYTNDALKKGPIYAAVSLLHQAGCTIKTGVQTPKYFLNC
ncbi:hypothetical protein ABPG74_005455 [Tetrahymena malaccensis]